MQRLPEIATKMMANNKAKSRTQAGPGAGRVGMGMGLGLAGAGRATQTQEFDIGVDDFPFYTHHVKDLYNTFIDTIAEECREKCNDEFYCTRLIYWENKNVLPAQKSKGSDKATDMSSVAATTEIRDTVAQLAANIFRNIKERVTRNVLLKCHNYFIVPMCVWYVNWPYQYNNWFDLIRTNSAGNHPCGEKSNRKLASYRIKCWKNYSK